MGWVGPVGKGVQVVVPGGGFQLLREGGSWGEVQGVVKSAPLHYPYYELIPILRGY